ncbi:protein FAM169B isoform X1 [Sapajus apella]|uniref:Protein FAM169B isoform X1 n=2 Tax=Sapajus apella TaxID=9515 RepID=A0A6J3FSE2_SAPAP|nr:protein FAM169B isoform X1 [Sapajus apella]
MRERRMRGSRGQPPGRGAVLPEPGMKTEAACGAAAGVYPVDVLDDDPDAHRKAALACYASLGEGAGASSEVFCLPTGEQVKLEASSVYFCTVHRDEPQHKILVLVNPQDTKTVVAVYIKESWWSTEDAIRTSDPAREGLMKVQSFGERIVLFILNVIIFGRLERNLDDDDMFFLPHSVKEQAKIMWRHGAAVGFYTTKMKGSLCGSGTGVCYLLPVFDTVFVRRKHRRQGLGTAMLRDFCETFPDDEALGVSYPMSPAMYQVCRQFLLVCPEERGRLWEVKPPGAWGQRINIWLKVQLQPRLPDSHPGNSEEEDVSRHARTSWNDRPRQSAPGDSSKQEVQAEARLGHLHILNVQPQTVRDDPITVFNVCGFFSDFRRGRVEKSWNTQRMIQTVERRRRTWGWWGSHRASLQGPVPDASGCPGCPSGPGPEACLGSQDSDLRLV